MDTTIWSLAFRRGQSSASERKLVYELSELIEELRAAMIGPIRQELLSGISDRVSFEKVQDGVAAFEDLPIVAEDYVEAARAYNTCRKKGVQGSHIDFLICAVAMRHAAPIFTMDKDFAVYARHLDLELYSPRT